MNIFFLQCSTNVSAANYLKNGRHTFLGIQKISMAKIYKCKYELEAMRISQGDCHIIDYDRSETARKYIIFQILGSILRNDARCKHEIKSSISMAKAAFNRKKNLITSELDLN